jgi:CRP/FNR family transcriptional regulator
LGPEYVHVTTDDRLVDEIARRLEHTSLFEGCYPADIAAIARRFEVRQVARGEYLILAGALGDEFFMLLSGAARRGGASERTRDLGPGDYFGELALLDPAPRSMDVVAVDECVVGVLSGSTFRVLLGSVPGVAPHLLASLARRLREAELGDWPPNTADGQPY